MAIPILSDIFGQKPQIAGFQDVILGDEQIKAILADLKAFPQIEKLGSLWQNYMLAGIEHAVPGFGSILSGITGTTKEELKQAGDLMKGIIPEDVISSTFRGSAMQNLTSGLGGAPMGLANQARNLGLTSLDMINQGANLLGNASQRWGQLAGFGASTLMPIQSMLITPEQQAQQTLSNRLIQRQIQQERFNVAAAPNPIAKGLSDIVMYLTGQYLGSLGGGKMGGGGGGGLPQAGNAAATQAEGSGDWMNALIQGTGSGNPAATTGNTAAGFSLPGTFDATANAGLFGPGGTQFPANMSNDALLGWTTQGTFPSVYTGGSMFGPPPESNLFGTDLYGTTSFSGVQDEPFFF